MIELIQFPWSPFCLVQQSILKFSACRSKSPTCRAPATARSSGSSPRNVYYGVPIIRDGKTVVFEVADDSQVIAKYLDEEFELGLFPKELRGVQPSSGTTSRIKSKAWVSSSTMFISRNS